MAVAYAARIVGSHATVVMPETAVAGKIAAIEEYGGTVVLVDGNRLLESMEVLQREGGQTFIHPFEHPHVNAGQGTVGLEIMDESPDIDAVVVPVGGGGLISGIAAAVKARSPKTLVIGVEPEGSACSHSEPSRSSPGNSRIIRHRCRWSECAMGRAQCFRGHPKASRPCRQRWSRCPDHRGSRSDSRAP